jgi:capsular exopolysaccharide synthesis family protein
MSRIHEALQRAAEQNGSSEAPAEEAAASDTFSMQEVTALTREPFPVEIEGARRLRKHGADAPPKADVFDQPDREEPAAEEPKQKKSLFEHIDVRLAEKVVVDANMSPDSREQYRRLAAVLHDAQGNTGLKVIMVASAVPGEGKTLTATNVALTLSDSYRRRVLLIDADLRKPTLHQVFKLNTTSGLIDGLEAQSEVKLVLRQMSANLAVLPAGRPTSDPMAGLTSERMRHLIDEAKETFDWVIIDTPPLMLLPDAHLLSSLVDGAVLVVKANSTAHELVKRTAEIIGRNRILGVVLNQAARPAHSHYGGYYGYYYLAANEGETRP